MYRLKEAIQTLELSAQRPRFVEPTFNHHYELQNRLIKGRQIEFMLNYHLYKEYYPVTIFKPEIIMSTRGTSKIKYSGEFGLSGSSYSHIENNIHQDLSLHFIESWFSIHAQFGGKDNDLHNKDFVDQFILIKDRLKPQKRLIIQPKINANYPDLILDNMIIDIKTDLNCKYHIKYLKQTLLYYYLYQHLLNSKIQFSKENILGRSIFMHPVDSVGIYYWKFNELSIYKVVDLIGGEDDTKIKNLTIEHFLTN